MGWLGAIETAMVSGNGRYAVKGQSYGASRWGVGEALRGIRRFMG
jgi:hypothetical protein